MTITKKSRNRTKRPSDLCKVSSKASIHSYVVFIATFLPSILPYLLTVSPSIAGGDSGELLAEGCNLGTSHPPGYPLYTILVFALKTMIVNRSTFSVAFLVNLSSCFFGALSSAFLSSSILLLLRGKRSKYFRKKDSDEAINAIAAITMGLCNSYSPLTWQYSTTAEVFALHNLLVSIILHSSVKFALDPSAANYRCGAFFCGLALTNQHTSILLSLPIGIWIFYSMKLYDPRKWIIVEKGTPHHLILIGAGAFLSSFIVLYGTLPFFAYMSPHAGSWGNVVSVRGFLNHFLRRDYGSLQLYSGDDTHSEGMVRRIFLWCWDFVVVQSNPFVGGCLLVGCKEVIMREFKRQTVKMQFASKRATARSSASQKTLSIDGMGVDMAILVSLVFYLVVFHSLANLPLNNDLFFGIHQRFWLHPNLLTCVIAGLGLASVMKKVVMIWPQQLRLIISLPLVIIFFVGLRGVAVNNQSDNYHFRNYAVSILSTLPENATLYINFDQTWTSVRYMQECEGMRRDVTSLHLGMMSYDWWETKIPLYPEMTFPGKQYVQGKPKWQNGGFTFSELLDANSDTSNGIFIAGNPSFPDPAYAHKFEEVPHGIVSEIVKKNEVVMASETFRVDSQDTWKQVLKQYATSGLPDKNKYDQVTWESTIVREFYDHFVSRATYLLDIAVKENESGTGNGLVVPSLAEACAWLELAMINDESSAQSPPLWKNLGLGYLHLVKSKETNIPILSDLLDPNATSFLGVDMQVWWDGDSKNWKTWASNRWQIAWSHYLGMKDAKSDESFEAVKSLYDAVMQATNPK
jgi:hypothetical protein